MMSEHTNWKYEEAISSLGSRIGEIQSEFNDKITDIKTDIKEIRESIKLLLGYWKYQEKQRKEIIDIMRKKP